MALLVIAAFISRPIAGDDNYRARSVVEANSAPSCATCDISTQITSNLPCTIKNVRKKGRVAGNETNLV